MFSLQSAAMNAHVRENRALRPPRPNRSRELGGVSPRLGALARAAPLVGTSEREGGSSRKGDPTVTEAQNTAGVGGAGPRSVRVALDGAGRHGSARVTVEDVGELLGRGRLSLCADTHRNVRETLSRLPATVT